jgi:hypothetical protein
MPRGGKRQGAGRIPLWQRTDCVWIVGRVREIGESDVMMQKRIRSHAKRKIPQQLAAHDELQENYDKLDHTSNEGLRAMYEDDAGTPLEETRAITADENFQSYVHIESPNQFLLNEIYKQVAAEASQRFGKPYSARNVKDRVSAWRTVERELKKTP